MKRIMIFVIMLAMLITSLPYGASGGQTTEQADRRQLKKEGIKLQADKQCTASELKMYRPVKDSTIEAINKFSYNTASRLLKPDGKNYCYSPLSLYYALALAATGAKGSTREELFLLLGISDAEELSEQSRNLYHQLYTNDEVSKLKISNSLWIDKEVGGKKIEYKDAFVDNAIQNFYASLFLVDFDDADTGNKMAQWISDNTNNTLTPTIDIDPEQIMSIINTVYFIDQWTDAFDMDRTAESIFKLPNGGQVKCDFMNNKKHSRFVKGSNFIRSDLALKNKCKMVFILPDKGTNVNELMATPEKMQKIFTQGQEYYGEVTWSVPKFSYDSKYDLRKTMQKLGVIDAFTSRADFTGITDYRACISDIIQQTHIGINEKGVEASAFTQINFVGVSVPSDKVKMILDRPFIYGIVTPDNIPLFVGVCNDPAK
jgi:serine protease inhibitor